MLEVQHNDPFLFIFFRIACNRWLARDHVTSISLNCIHIILLLSAGGGGMVTSCGDARSARRYTAEDIHARNGSKNPKSDKQFLAVIDGYVVDASRYGADHPGKIKKMLSSNSPKIGATGQWFGFSFKGQKCPLSRNGEVLGARGAALSGW